MKLRNVFLRLAEQSDDNLKNMSKSTFKNKIKTNIVNDY